MKYFTALNVFFCLVILTACNAGKHSPAGFSLPEGDADAGKSTFTELACNACHSTPDIAQLDSDSSEKISVPLGGKVRRVQTYADLVTSIINPSHRFSKVSPAEMVMEHGKSRMPDYNSMLTVDQLINLVTYLQPHYKLQVYERTVYRSYHP